MNHWTKVSHLSLLFVRWRVPSLTCLWANRSISSVQRLYIGLLQYSYCTWILNYSSRQMEILYKGVWVLGSDWYSFRSLLGFNSPWDILWTGHEEFRQFQNFWFFTDSLTMFGLLWFPCTTDLHHTTGSSLRPRLLSTLNQVSLHGHNQRINTVYGIITFHHYYPLRPTPDMSLRDMRTHTTNSSTQLYLPPKPTIIVNLPTWTHTRPE